MRPPRQGARSRPEGVYRFAASKDELLDGIIELVLGELKIPPNRGGPSPQALMGGLPRPVALGQIPPRRARPQLPQDR
jgi:hypothetical protein